MSNNLFFERQEQGQRALLLHIRDAQAKPGQISHADERSEFHSLALAAGAEVVAELDAPVKRANPATLVGSGKVEEAAAQMATSEADLVLVSRPLTPVQERNLEAALKCRVLDRTGLILDIFAQRARSHEGQLQVELAQLKHLSTRLVGGWKHLERQRGGIGLRGPGETQLETDRRLVAERIRNLQQRLDKVDRVRQQGRRARQRAGLPVVSLVGYTNAGKSTLFNHLTDAEVYAADQLFATLDTTLRRVDHNDCGAILLSDTVGFVQHLPHELVAAFRATLQETRDADLLLHVVDSSDPEYQERIHAVEDVLAEIGAGEIPSLLVYNKIDIKGEAPSLSRDSRGIPTAVRLSAVTGAGVELLWQAVGERLGRHRVQRRIRLPFAAAALRARLYALGAVTAEQVLDNELELDVDLSSSQARELSKLAGIDGEIALRELLTDELALPVAENLADPARFAELDLPHEEVNHALDDSPSANASQR